MPLASGARLGPYEVLGLIGAGGMGEVYRARDTRLDRTVAIKVLPAHVSADPERRARFEREAKTISQLNHPHICVLHDVGEVDLSSTESRVPFDSAQGKPGTVRVSYLVMEYLEGQTLAQRLVKGRLALDEALRIGVDIADALAAAHKHGVIHRDLKPSNVMLARTGSSGPPTVKLLDFGLAKAVEPLAALAVTTTGATDTDSLTSEGRIVGTLPYMAPEQLEGKPADARTDLWAFGCVLYEMLAGRRAFEGDSSASLTSAIMRVEPPALATLEPLTPPALERLVRKCLAKSPDERWDSAHDVADELRWVGAQQSAAQVGAVEHPPAHRRRRWWVTRMSAGAAAIGLVAAGAGLMWSLGGRFASRPSHGAQRFLLDPRPAGGLGGFTSRGRPSRVAIDLSPNGRTIAFVASGPDDVDRLYIRHLTDDAAVAMPGTDGAAGPFFSPDGEWVGFWANGQLMKVHLDGGPAVRLCATSAPFGASWAPDGTIVFAQEFGPLLALSSSADTPRPLTAIPAGTAETHRLPHVLPDGSGVLFTSLDAAPFSIAEWSTARVELFTFATGSRQVVMRDAADGRYLTTGHLLYARQSRLEAVPFDLARVRTTGGAAGVQSEVMWAVNSFNTITESGAMQVAVSGTGTLAYVPGGFGPDPVWTFWWMDRAGALEQVPIQSGPYISLRVSPDGRRLTFRGSGSKPGVWVYDLARADLERITDGASHRWPLWTPDGRGIVYSRSDEQGQWSLILHDLGTGARATLAPGYGAAAWSPSGDTLVYTTPGDPSVLDGSDIWVLTRQGKDMRTSPWLQTRAREGQPALSPDGLTLAYVSDESGRMEVYLDSFPRAGGRQKVSPGGGREPLWAPGGREIFYLGPCPRNLRTNCPDGEEPNGPWNSLYSVAVGSSMSPNLGRPRFLARVPRMIKCWPLRCYDLTPDGQRFIVMRLPPGDPSSETRPREIRVVVDWFEELKAKVPVK